MRRLVPTTLTIVLLGCGGSPRPATPAQSGASVPPLPAVAAPAAVGGIPTVAYGPVDTAATREMRDSLAAYAARKKAR